MKFATIFALAVALLTTSTAHAGLFNRRSPIVSPTPTPDLAGERIVQLPEDGGQWETLVAYETDTFTSERDQRLRSMLYNDARLSALRTQTRFVEMGPSNPHLKSSAYANMPRPALVISRPRFDRSVSGEHFNTGIVEPVYRNYGSSLPLTAARLSGQIQGAFDRCPKPKPTPGPVVETPSVDPPPKITPDEPAEPVADETDSETTNMQIAFGVIASLLSLLVGFKLWG